MQGGKLSWRALPYIVFLVLLIHGATLGLTDDEAYYWVLAQRPAWGYAFHPPAMAWMIAFFQGLLGRLLGFHSAGLVRLPAALSVAVILALSLKWLSKVGVESRNLTRSGLTLLSFTGFFFLAWMMVPDIPLFLGWTLAFVSTWNICFEEERPLDYALSGLGAALLILSKYSGILAVFSIFLSLLLWADSRRRWRAFLYITIGIVLAAIPILIWNSQHDWASILYQIHDRHEGASLSFLRYARFWIIEALVAGPLLVSYAFVLIKNAFSSPVKHSVRQMIDVQGGGQGSQVLRQVQVSRFGFVWMTPAALVFCIQPLFSDFKPHWAFVVWWPVALVLATVVSDQTWKWIRYQVIYGLCLGILILICCHIPVGSWMEQKLKGSQFDPRLDVTNDLYGWSELEFFLKTKLKADEIQLPVVASRYQTASQAAFALSGMMDVTLIPRDLKERDEWPDLRISEGQGPAWPRLKSSVLFVSDNRYDAPPEFQSADCKKQWRLEKTRWGLRVKWIDVWRCDPR